MSDEEQTGEQTGEQAPNTAEDEAQARRIGWRPREQYRGPPETWVDATEFLRRGREYIPILQANNQKQEAEINSLRERLEAAERLNHANTAALSKIQEVQQELTAGSLEADREALDDEIVKAHEEGDIRAELKLRDKRAELSDRINKAKEPPAKAEVTERTDFTKTAEFIQFEQDNPWFREDEAMAAASTAIGRKMASAGELDGLSPAQRFAKIAEATKKRFGYEDNARRQRTVRVESGGGGAEGLEPRGKSYSDMPVEAQQACDRAAKRLVGPGKRYKDEISWRKQYAKDYFETP
jgi:hypothetical protein